MSDFKDSLENNFKEHRESLESFEEWISNQPHIPKNIRE
jgi:hypothetical protein